MNSVNVGRLSAVAILSLVCLISAGCKRDAPPQPGSAEALAEADEALAHAEQALKSAQQAVATARGGAAGSAAAPVVPVASPTAGIEGRWGIDVLAMRDTAEFRKMPEEEREMAMKMMEAMAGAMSIEITADRMIMEGMGKKEESSYRVESAEGSRLVLEARSRKEDGFEKVETLNVEVRGRDSIIVKSGDGEAMPLKRK